jgi:hypothetical protein
MTTSISHLSNNSQWMKSRQAIASVRHGLKSGPPVLSGLRRMVVRALACVRPFPAASAAGVTSARLPGRSGQTALLATLSLPLVFGAVGLVVDLGWCYFLKERVQTAADGAASAAAVYALNNSDTCATVSCGTALNCSGITAPPTSSLTAGCLYATADGPPILTASMIENDSSHLPAGLTGVSPTMWVKATVTASALPGFLAILGVTANPTIRASAIAGVSAVPPTSCVYALDPSASGALTVKGTAVLGTTNCAVYVNSNSSSALVKTGSGSINSTVDIVGNYSLVGSGSISPLPNTGQASISDPLSGLPAPTFSGCDFTNYSVSGNATLTHGVYCGGVHITGSGTITMGPGIYVMNGGGFSSGGSASINATHVMIYNTATAGQTIGAVQITGSGTLTMSAPNTGVYEGILIFQDRSQTIAGQVSGSDTSVVTGSLYFADANLTYTGTTAAQYTALVADTITMVGTSDFKNDDYGTYTGISIAKAVMLQ